MSGPDSSAAGILDYLEGERERMVDFIRQLVESESPSNQPELHADTRRIISHRLVELGFRTLDIGTCTGSAHVYARPEKRRRGLPNQLLVGHYDTVWPVGTVAERPFAVDGDILRGPGSFDMKGGIAQIAFALEAIERCGGELPATPCVFINSDEEIGSRTSTRFIRRLAKASIRAFVMEPALGETGRLKTSRKGIGRYDIKVFGRPAHAGLNPEQGSSAILELAGVIQKLFQLNDPQAGISVNVGTIDGGLQPNVVAPHSSAVVDVRVPSQADADRVHAAITSIKPTLDGTRIVVEGGIGRPSMEPTPRNRRLWARAKALGDNLGLGLDEASVGGGSDGNTTSQFTATLDGLGPVGDGAHAEHEFLRIDRTIERTALLALLLLSPAGDDEKSAP